jgi:hypothetical protein
VRRLIDAFLKQRGSHRYKFRLIHREDLNRYPANRGESDQNGTVESKVFTPSVLPRVKQPLNSVARRVSTCDVGSFVTIAVKAAESKIRQLSASTVLTSNNVIYLERQSIVRKRNSAVLAPSTGPAPDLLHQTLVHEWDAEPSCVLR